MRFRFPAVAGVLLAFALPVHAQDVSPADGAAIRAVIRAQVEAFGRDDGDSAFGYASPAIRQLFGTADAFMEMVRQGYRPVYRPTAFEFGEIVARNGQLIQEVHVVGPDGRPVTADYPMTRLPDGSWRIDGCRLHAAPEHQA
jgi:hypothetical protein